MSAGGLVYVILGLIAIAFFYEMYGVIVQEMVSGPNGLNEQFENPDMHVSQQRMDTADATLMIWKYLPWIAMIMMFMFGVVIALRESNGNVSDGW